MAAVVVLMACAASAQNPPGFNYNPYLYYPYTALQPPVQDTPDVAAARATHLAAHAAAAAAAARVVPVAGPAVLVAQPVNSIPDTVDVLNAKIEHWRAHAAAAAANGVISSLPPLVVVQANPGLPQPVQDTPEVAAARAAHLAAHQAALVRSG